MATAGDLEVSAHNVRERCFFPVNQQATMKFEFARLFCHKILGITTLERSSLPRKIVEWGLICELQQHWPIAAAEGNGTIHLDLSCVRGPGPRCRPVLFPFQRVIKISHIHWLLLV